MKELKLKARAKINLGLDVLRKREDGYHELRMIMQTIQLCDDLILTRKAEAGITVTTNSDQLPVNEDNLVYRAAKLLMEEAGMKEGISIHLEKRIPIAAGMAGGSADAAAVLVGVNQMFDLGLTKTELMQRGVKLGADIPYCIMRGTALSEGIGEILTPLPPMPKCSIVIAKPEAEVSTGFVYGNLKANELTSHPDIDGQVEALKNGDLDGIVSRMGNVLETVTIPAYPVIEQIKEIMKAEGADGAMMSGSGPTVFGIFRDETKAQKAFSVLKQGDLAKYVFLTECFQCGEE